MSRQALVIGLGQFGSAVCRSLTDQGVEVLAVDRRPERVQLAIEHVADAVCLNAMDEDALGRTAPARRDVCVVAIGDESREASILSTALLRQMGAPRIVARATDPLHARILRQVGAHEVVNPERAYGERLAVRLAHDGILEMVPLGEDLVITELVLPVEFVGRSLTQLALPRRKRVTVVAIRRQEGAVGRLLLPDPADALREGDVLVIVSRAADATALADGR